MDSRWFCEYAWLPACMINFLSKCQRMGLECKSNCMPTAHPATVYLLSSAVSQDRFVYAHASYQEVWKRTAETKRPREVFCWYQSISDLCVLNLNLNNPNSGYFAFSGGFLVKTPQRGFWISGSYLLFSRSVMPEKWKQTKLVMVAPDRQIYTQARPLSNSSSHQPWTAGGPSMKKILLSYSWVSVCMAPWMCTVVGLLYQSEQVSILEEI